MMVGRVVLRVGIFLDIEELGTILEVAFWEVVRIIFTAGEIVGEGFGNGI